MAKIVKDTKRLNLEIPIEMHKEIKMVSAEKNISIKLWVMRILMKELQRIKSFK